MGPYHKNIHKDGNKYEVIDGDAYLLEENVEITPSEEQSSS